MSATAVTTSALIGCEDVSVAYGDHEARVDALTHVDLAIDLGERVALWGRSGSGKTTLLHVLGGLVVPTHGRVSWRGRELSSLDVAARGRARARGIAYVFQGSNLLVHFSAYENVAFAREASAALAAERDAGRDAERSAEPGGPTPERPDYSPEELLALVGLSDKLDALPSELSGGEAQRVAIARALAQSPELLLCDEPTGHLDTDTAWRVLDLIDTLQGEFGFALVTATHDVDVAARARRIVELTDGSVVERSRP